MRQLETEDIRKDLDRLEKRVKQLTSDVERRDVIIFNQRTKIEELEASIVLKDNQIDTLQRTLEEERVCGAGPVDVLCEIPGVIEHRLVYMAAVLERSHRPRTFLRCAEHNPRVAPKAESFHLTHVKIGGVRQPSHFFHPAVNPRMAFMPRRLLLKWVRNKHAGHAF